MTPPLLQAVRVLFKDKEFINRCLFFGLARPTFQAALDELLRVKNMQVCTDTPKPAKRKYTAADRERLEKLYGKKGEHFNLFLMRLNRGIVFH